MLKGRTRRALPAPQHGHCDQCFDRRCPGPALPADSCPLTPCRLLCGAVFHACKGEEHQLLCPLEPVPCLNSAYGCPASMARQKLAGHLQACPASVVSCSMEWNRWPSVDSDAALHENIMKEPSGEECLDAALALRDQRILFGSLKMLELFPEARDAGADGEAERDEEREEEWDEEGWEEEEEKQVVERDGGRADSGRAAEEPRGDPGPDGAGLSQQEREALASGREGMDLESYSRWEHIFRKEQAASGAEARAAQPRGSGEPSRSPVAAEEVPGRGAEVTGLAPWQDGVLERLKMAMDARDYNMYLVHNGRMLIHFGQIPACTPREKDFVYGNLEAQEVKTVHTFKVPVSYCGKRARLGDALGGGQPSEHKAVDTSDLGVAVGELSRADAVRTALQCALERELRGHPISESRSVDGLYVDLATQTYDFEAGPFAAGTVLADLAPAGQPSLHVALQSEGVTHRHNKSSSAFTFTCGQVFRRDEFAAHFRNVHADLQAGLYGWFQRRCPLAYRGCTFVQSRLGPPGLGARVIYRQDLSAFAIRPEVAPELGAGRGGPRGPGRMDRASLSGLPLELLQHIASYLDSVSLSQLAQVSMLLQDVCSSLLQERGMVLLQWEKRRCSRGRRSTWRAHKKVWQFSSLFSRVHTWHFHEVAASMAEHLKSCPFNIVERKVEPFPLTSLCGTRGPTRPSVASACGPGS
ncbi:F-box only protein 40 [Tachyglossus aculeatus]|uniref:F-box only protein 40 n=1 Tax=Tachyglossus aculeatus TaxID=9261 RepID=UPI0018F5D14C|nr:F-box only protein 40 [Tachyglossus aculeatus]